MEKISQGINNKVSVILSLRKEWRKAAYRGKLDVKEMFLAYDQECWKVQLEVTKESIEIVDILVCNHEEADTRLRYMSSMQLNIEIRKSVWFLTTHTAVLGVSNSDQAIGKSVSVALPGLDA